MLRLGRHRLAAFQQGIAAKGHHDAHLRPHRGDKHRLDRMQPVLGLIEDDRGGGFEHLVRHLHASNAIGLEHSLARDRVAVVEGGQAVQEFGVGLPVRSITFLRDREGRQQRDALGPDGFGLAHRHPDIGIDEVAALRPSASFSVSVIRAPLASASLRHWSISARVRPKRCGPHSRISIPISAAPTISDDPMLPPVSPTKQKAMSDRCLWVNSRIVIRSARTCVG
jgi:hypothetical protein